MIIEQIKNLDGNVVAIVCDDNRTNQSFFRKFDCISPWLTADNIFLLYDYVHLIKCVRNNWITEKIGELEFTMNVEKRVAKWDDLRKLHQLELQELAKMSKLTNIAVNLTPIERQNVPTCLKEFCEETLKLHQGICDNDGTVSFIDLIIEFWNIVNVKDLYAGVRNRVVT